jgi:Flp pilus assembly protein TadD
VWDLLAAIGIAVIALMLYAGAAGFGFSEVDDTRLTRDDARFLQTAPFGDAFSTQFFRDGRASSFYYRPLVTLSFMLDARRASAGDASALHATNVFLHAIAGALLLLACRRAGMGLVVAGSVAALFVAHPVAVEAVAWIPGRVEVLFAIWGLLALIALQGALERPTVGRFVLHGLAILGALLTKEGALTLPCVFATYIWLVSRMPARLKDWRLLAAWAGPVVVWALLRSHAIVAGSNLIASLPKALASAPALLVHLGKIVLPIELDVVATLRDSSLWPGACALLLVIAAAYWLHGPARRSLLFGVIAAFFILVPTLAVSDYMILEARIYAVLPFAMLALGGALSSVADAPPAPSGARGLRSPLGIFLGAAVVALFAWRARVYLPEFRSAASFAEAAIRGSPGFSFGYNQAGAVAQWRGDLAGAERYYRQAIALNPDERMVRSNLGTILALRGDHAGAVVEYQAELARNPMASTFSNLGVSLYALGRLPEAADAFQSGVALSPDSVDNLGKLYRVQTELGRVVDAERTRSRLEALGATSPRGAVH